MMLILVECFYFHKTKKLSERKSRCEYSCLADDWLSVMARHVVEPFKRDNFKDICSYLNCCIVEVKRTLHTISMRINISGWIWLEWCDTGGWMCQPRLCLSPPPPSPSSSWSSPCPSSSSSSPSSPSSSSSPDSVVVEVVEHGQAALVPLAVVRLGSVVSDYNHHSWLLLLLDYHCYCFWPWSLLEYYQLYLIIIVVIRILSVVSVNVVISCLWSWWQVIVPRLSLTIFYPVFQDVFNRRQIHCKQSIPLSTIIPDSLVVQSRQISTLIKCLHISKLPLPASVRPIDTVVAVPTWPPEVRTLQNMALR